MSSLSVKLIDFEKEYHSIKNEINFAVFRVLESGWYLLGEEISGFEKELASFVGTKYAVGVASGTDALTLSLKALGLKKSDGVVVPANVYPTAFGVALSGAKLELADVDPETLNITVDTLKKAVNSKTRAVVAVHLYGNPVDIAPIKKFCRDRGLYLIEDCAQAIGAKYRGRNVGMFGDISCFSFYPTKNLGAYGDAGAVLTNSRKLARKVQLLRMYGEEDRYKSVLLGHNSRMDEIQAAVLRVKLRHLAKWNKKRLELAKMYRKQLTGLPVKVLSETGKPVYHLFVIMADKRRELSSFLKSKNIETGIHYPTAVHQTPSFSGLGHKCGDFPVTEKAVCEVLSLPLHPFLEEKDVKYVVGAVREFYSK